MRQQGVMFSGESPIMEGKWYNPSTGDSFIVRNTFFEDNQLIVQTMDGRILEYNQLQHYVQSNGNDPMPVPQDKSTVSTMNNQLPPEVTSLISDDGMLADDAQLIMGYSRGSESVNLGNINETRQPEQKSEPANFNESIISKALSKLDLPKLDINIDDTTIPETAVKMLHDIMDISTDEIVLWYVNNMDIDEIRSQISDQLNTYISKLLS